MIFMTRVFIVCLLLLCVSCSGKGNTNIQSQVGQSEAAVEKVPVTETMQETEATQGSGSLAESLQMEMFYCTDTDRVYFNDYIAYIEPFKSYEMPELIIKTAYFFLNKPYVASTLEFEPEGLVVNLRELDCTTFVETVLALSRAVKLSDNPTFEDFCGQLRNIRYRRGTVGDYTSRIHYFSDWIYENETRGHVKDVTKEIGGESYKLKLNYMSTHPDSYRQLKSHPEYIEIVRKNEMDISERNVYSNIPVTRIISCGEKMKDGDVVCFVTGIEGLDITHVGFIHINKGQLTFIHASSSAKKVIINPQDLSGYLERNKSNIGVMIVRPYELK